MRIGMMSTWNIPCGASLHAQLIGSAWLQRGHELTVFAPYGPPTTREEDEPWIVRNYSLGKPLCLDSSPLLSMDYDVFVLQQMPPTPMRLLLSLAAKIKKKAKTVAVIHEGRPPSVEFTKFPWDALVCFDERYKEFLLSAFPEEKIHIIRYPCHPVEHGDRVEARRELLLPSDRMIVLIYGIAVHHHIHLLPSLERVNKKKPLLFLIYTGVHDWFDIYETTKSRYDFVEVRMGVLEMDELYRYLHASDALIYHRDSSVDIVVPSTIYACMGSGCPILASSSNFVEKLKREVLKYQDLNRLQQLLLYGADEFQSAVAAATRYAQKNSADKIAAKFIKLFKKL